MIYSNAQIDRTLIVKNHKDKSGIYLWTHLDSGKKYIGSSVNLSKRIDFYY